MQTGRIEPGFRQNRKTPRSGGWRILENGLNGNITFVMFAFNEIERIRIVIKNFKPFGRILVVDNFSTDDTVKIAREEGCDVLLHKNPGWMEDEDTVLRVKDAVKTEWIYWGYTDEMVDYPAIQEILRHIESKKYDIINITRKNYYYGKFLSDLHLTRTNRIFKKNALDFTGNKIHSFGRPTVSDDRIKMLDGQYFVHHFISNTAKSYLGVMDRYTDVEMHEERNRSHLRIFMYAIRLFTFDYVFRGGYKTGMAGMYINLFQVFYQFLSKMKQFEQKHGLDRRGIEDKNNIVRNKIQNDIDASIASGGTR